MIFSAGDKVIYAAHGICEIKEISPLDFGNESKDYYVLYPVYDSKSKYFVPVEAENTPSKLRPILSKKEIEELVLRLKHGTIEWIQNDNQRKEFCNCVIRNGDREEIISVMDMLYTRQRSLVDSKRHFHVNDEKCLRDCERLIFGEFAYVLGIETTKVIGYIEEKLNINK